jgi:hypothetical protein
MATQRFTSVFEISQQQQLEQSLPSHQRTTVRNQITALE